MPAETGNRTPNIFCFIFQRIKLKGEWSTSVLGVLPGCQISRGKIADILL